MFAGREHDHMTSKKLVRELADTASAPSTVFHRSLWIGHFLRFWEGVKPGASTAEEPPAFELVERFVATIVQYLVGRGIDKPAPSSSTLRQGMRHVLLGLEWRHRDFRYTTRDRRRLNPARRSTMASDVPCPQHVITSDLLVHSRDGVRLCLFLKNGLERPWGWKANPIWETEKAVFDLTHEYPPSVPHDVRHREDLPGAPPATHQVQGSYHFAYWVAQGHAHSAAHRRDSVSRFFKSLAPLTQTISLLFQGLDPVNQARYQASYCRIAERSALAEVQHCDRSRGAGDELAHFGAGEERAQPGDLRAAVMTSPTELDQRKKFCKQDQNRKSAFLRPWRKLIKIGNKVQGQKKGVAAIEFDRDNFDIQEFAEKIQKALVKIDNKVQDLQNTHKGVVAREYDRDNFDIQEFADKIQKAIEMLQYYFVQVKIHGEKETGETSAFRRKLALVASRDLWIVPRFGREQLQMGKLRVADANRAADQEELVALRAMLDQQTRAIERNLPVHISRANQVQQLEAEVQRLTREYTTERRAELEAGRMPKRWQWVAALHRDAPDLGDVVTATPECTRRWGLDPEGWEWIHVAPELRLAMPAYLELAEEVLRAGGVLRANRGNEEIEAAAPP
ncbi:MAG: hypothetical protein M1826_001119 [Phylliscum demangeonii]|nr:MAG: hypothetical protein M1826_001119 [Phylliscum demangeonii]